MSSIGSISLPFLLKARSENFDYHLYQLFCCTYIIKFLNVGIDRLLVGDPDVDSKVGLG